MEYLKLNNDFYRDIDIEMENIDTGLLEIERHEVRPESVDEDAVPEITQEGHERLPVVFSQQSSETEEEKNFHCKGEEKNDNIDNMSVDQECCERNKEEAKKDKVEMDDGAVKHNELSSCIRR